jgi:hypothetical protein
MGESLVELATRASQGDTNALRSLQKELESDLVPLVRCALRRGGGLPALVQWARGRFADLTDTPEPLNARQASPLLARVLCVNIVRNLAASEENETVRGH